MLNRDFSTTKCKMCQLQHTTQLPHIEFIQLKPNDILKHIHYLVKREDVLSTQRNGSHPIHVHYSEDQFTYRVQDKN